jgi:predicted transcriptional regulator
MNHSDKIKDKSEFIQKKTAKIANVFLLIMNKFMNGAFLPTSTLLVTKLAESVCLDQGKNVFGVQASIHGLLSEIEFYLQLTRNSGYLNEGQYLIVRDEIRYLKTFVQISGANKADLIAELRFDTKGEFETGFEEQYYKGHVVTHKRHSPKELSEVGGIDKGSRSVEVPPKNAGTVIESDVPDSVPVVSNTRSLPSLQTKNTARRNTIVTILKTRPNLTIKDFSHVIADVSEKTIQRELNTLVEEGVVVRTGERRWSKYSLTS